MDTKRRVALAFDIDGVFANFAQAFINLVNEKFDTHITFEEWDTYGSPTAHGPCFTDEQWRYGWDTFLNTPRFWFNLEAFEPYTMKLLGELASYGEVLLYFTTRRRDLTAGEPHERDCRLLTKWWLNKYGITDAQAVIAGWQNRVDLLKQLEIDAYIDDYAPQVEQCMAAGINTYLINRPWNRKESCSAPRVDSVAHFLDIVDPQVSKLYETVRAVDQRRIYERLSGIDFSKIQLDPKQIAHASNILVAE